MVMSVMSYDYGGDKSRSLARCPCRWNGLVDFFREM